MKNVTDIQLAHDLLDSIERKRVPRPLTEIDASYSAGALDALCWILEHPRGAVFDAKLTQLIDWLRSRGYRPIPRIQ